MERLEPIRNKSDDTFNKSKVQVKMLVIKQLFKVWVTVHSVIPLPSRFYLPNKGLSSGWDVFLTN